MKRPSIFDFSGMGKRPKLSKFDLSHENKLACDMGYLVPFLNLECIPGDSFRINSEFVMRYQALLSPIMHRVDLYSHYFFVPYRLLMDEWPEFITGGQDGTATPILPYWTIADAYNGDGNSFLGVGSLADYLGLPPAASSGTFNNDYLNKRINVLPFKAYQLIWSEYFRDQNLEPSIEDELDTNVGVAFRSGGDWGSDIGYFATICPLRKRAWEKDYFTSALPFAQRGAPVAMELDINYKNEAELYRASDGANYPSGDALITANDGIGGGINVSGQDVNAQIKNIESASFTINALRMASRLQEWLEKNARGGARYVEQILSHFGVLVPDYRLQRPEFLGGHKQPISISEVLQTSSQEVGGEPAGQMYGHGISMGANSPIKYRCQEHGIILGILSIVPRTAYQDTLPKYFSRMDKLDFAFPEFAQLGEQEVPYKEVFFNPFVATSGGRKPDDTFGYQSRYAEYKYKNDEVHGAFRDTLDFWHLSRKFANAPALNSDFTQCTPRTDIFATQEISLSSGHCLVDVFNRVSALRPLPYFSVPRL